MKGHIMRETLKAFYLDWVNNYLTIEKLAEHHEISYLTAKTLVSFGRYYHNKDIKNAAQTSLKKSYGPSY